MTVEATLAPPTWAPQHLRQAAPASRDNPVALAMHRAAVERRARMNRSRDDAASPAPPIVTSKPVAAGISHAAAPDGRRVLISLAALAHALPTFVEQSKLSARSIVDVVCHELGVDRDEFVSPSRTGRLVKARQIATLIIREKVGMSLPQISGKILGGRDHSTAISGIKTCRKKIASGQWAADYNRVIDILEGRRNLSPKIEPVIVSKKRRTKWTDEAVANVISLRDHGYTCKQVSAELGITEKRLKAMLNERGLFWRKRDYSVPLRVKRTYNLPLKRPPAVWTTTLAERATELRRAKVPLPQAAAELGVTPDALRHWARRRFGKWTIAFHGASR